jgi:hypothetical protein
MDVGESCRRQGNLRRGAPCEYMLDPLLKIGNAKRSTIVGSEMVKCRHNAKGNAWSLEIYLNIH